MTSSLRHQSVALAVICFLAMGAVAQEPVFERFTIDPDNPSDPHCKTLGDIDGDGLLDAIAASSSGGGMFWYEYPDWTRHTVRVSGSWTTDMQAGDVDADGDLDLILPNGSGLQWYENPGPVGDPRVDLWTEHLIGTGGANHHDVEIADVDSDGRLDVVSRDKGGGATYLWQQVDPDQWNRITISTSAGEGTALGDLDGDGDLDVLHNGFWVEQLAVDSWSEHDIVAGFADDVGALIADVDGDGTADVVLAPSESSGRFSWFEAADPVNGPWTEHSIDPSVSFFHTFRAFDMDGDNDLDLITAEMHQSGDPDEVSLYLNQGQGLAWVQQVVATTGSHNIRVGDIGADGDLDIFGANWNDSAPNSAVIEYWDNQTELGPLPLDQWQRHIVETSLPWQSVFVDGVDLDGNGLPDLVVGGWWYPNPGTLGGAWTRRAIGSPLDNFAVAWDLDGDGDADLLGTDGRVNGDGFSWAQNDGAGNFGILAIDHPPSGGDFLQGASVGQLVDGAEVEVVLSWHNGAAGTSMFTVPVDPLDLSWPLETISPTTNSEQVPIGDLDGDGDADVHLGDSWLEQTTPGVFALRPGVALSSGVPDRVVLADLDGDLDLDVVIGVEFGQLLVWGENQSSGAVWVEREIATDFDYFSVGVGDVDRDGDVDVVGGAHQANGEVTLYENDGSGGGWAPYVIDPGDSSQIDHHDGTRLVDMDLDGDLDVISVGWTRRSLVIYENLALNPDGADLVAPTLEAVSALGDPRRVTVLFSEPVDATTAAERSNYAISDGVQVGLARLEADGETVTLATTPLSEGVTYTLTVDAVEDLAGNEIAPGSQAVFVYVDEPLENGLVAYWPLDAAAGTLAVDATGNGHNGTLTNGARFVGGPAVGFDGVDDLVDVGTLDVAGSAITIATWFYAEDLANCGSRDCRLVSKATGTAESDHYLMLSTIASGSETLLRFRLKAGGATSTLVASSGPLAENVWMHAAAVYDGVEMRLYLDGALVGSTGKSGAITTDATVSTWLGGNPPGATDRPWPGRLDDVRIYDRALTAAEIQLLPPPSSELFWEVRSP